MKDAIGYEEFKKFVLEAVSDVANVVPPRGEFAATSFCVNGAGIQIIMLGDWPTDDIAVPLGALEGQLKVHVAQMASFTAGAMVRMLDSKKGHEAVITTFARPDGIEIYQAFVTRWRRRSPTLGQWRVMYSGDLQPQAGSVAAALARGISLA